MTRSKRAEAQDAKWDTPTIAAVEEAASEPLNPHRVEAPYAYYTDDGVLQNWAHNQVITNPEEITHLKKRGARLSEIKP